MSEIYSIIRCTGKNAHNCIENQYQGDLFGMRGTHKINDDDQLIWFSTSDIDSNIVDEKFLLDKLQILGKGKVYDDPNTTTKTYKSISGTIKC
jgi:hypothetical protein